MSESLHIRGMPDDTVCQVHDWPTEGLARRLIETMRSAHGKGGINACVGCIERAKSSLPNRKRSSTSPRPNCGRCGAVMSWGNNRSPECPFCDGGAGDT